MTRKLILAALLLTLTVAAPLHADVKKEERNQVAFSGMLGRMFNFFGGRSAKEGVVSTVAVSGDRKMTTSGDNTAQIVDLREEKIYDLDMRRKTYKVTTFEEIRRQLREAEAKAREAAARESKEEPKNESTGKQKEMEVDFDIKNTGQTKAINGYDTRQVVATITVREKGRKIEDSGGIVMTVDTWLTKGVSLKEITDFERRYWEKLAAGQVSAVNAQQMATAMAMFPGLKEAFARLSKEDFGGTSIQSTTTIDAVKSAEQMKQQASNSSTSSSETPASLGGAIGGFMKRRQQQKEQETPAAANANPARSTFMTMNNEVLKIATNVTAADVALPEGFKERN
jgi:hypothetical protein